MQPSVATLRRVPEDQRLAQPAAPAHAPPRARLPLALLRAARPRQWLKNVLVLAAPAAAGVLFDPVVLTRAAGAFVAFCLAASGTYLLNDAHDVEADRRHPTKRTRPIAAGELGLTLARSLGLAALLAAVALGLLIGDGWLAAVIAGYVVLMQAYSLWLRSVAVIELAVVSSGFVIRAIGGGVATDLPLSEWFLIVTSFGSLFIIVGKRLAEQRTLGAAADGHRASLSAYPPGFLDYVGAVSAAVAIVAYCLWSLLGVTNGHVWFELSIVPFVLAILRYALLALEGKAGAPEDVFLGDRAIQVLGALWAVAYAAGVYA